MRGVQRTLPKAILSTFIQGIGDQRRLCLPIQFSTADPRWIQEFLQPISEGQARALVRDLTSLRFASALLAAETSCAVLPFGGATVTGTIAGLFRVMIAPGIRLARNCFC
jgi:hypothetical protein